MRTTISELNETHLKVINEALEMYSRVFLGQIEYVNEFLRKHFDTHLSYEETERLALNLKKAFFPFPAHASYGICSPAVDESAKTAYDIQCAIRYKLAWDTHPNGGLTVDFSPPLHVGKEPLIQVEIKK